MVNVVSTPRDLVPKVGNVLSTHLDVRKISFTGSTAVGKQLLKQAAGTVKRTSMELGGNAPFVVSRPGAACREGAKVVAGVPIHLVKILIGNCPSGRR